jgi:hypothetical protein
LPDFGQVAAVLEAVKPDGFNLGLKAAGS